MKRIANLVFAGALVLGCSLLHAETVVPLQFEQDQLANLQKAMERAGADEQGGCHLFKTNAVLPLDVSVSKDPRQTEASFISKGVSKLNDANVLPTEPKKMLENIKQFGAKTTYKEFVFKFAQGKGEKSAVLEVTVKPQYLWRKMDDGSIAKIIKSAVITEAKTSGFNLHPALKFSAERFFWARGLVMRAVQAALS